MTILIIIALVCVALICYSVRRVFRVCAADRAEMDEVMRWRADCEKDWNRRKIAEYEIIVARKK